MKGFLLDTNVPSEMTRPRPQSSVSEWLDNADDDRLYQRGFPRRDSERDYDSPREQASQRATAMARRNLAPMV